jgi:hypothetical protein
MPKATQKKGGKKEVQPVTREFTVHLHKEVFGTYPLRSNYYYVNDVKQWLLNLKNENLIIVVLIYRRLILFIFLYDI